MASPLPPDPAGREDIIRDEPPEADSTQQDSPLPPDLPGREDIIRPDPDTRAPKRA
jgi:hypothetical protein